MTGSGQLNKTVWLNHLLQMSKIRVVKKAVEDSYERVKSGDGAWDGDREEIAPPSRNGAPHGIPKEDIFEILSHRRRRYILHYLKRNGTSARIGDMARQIAAWENEVDVDKVTTTQHKRLYTALYQSHLPRMDDAGILEYDQESGTAELTDEGEKLDVYLEFVPSGDINWAQYYLGLAVLSAALVLAHYLSIYPFTLSETTVMAVIVTAFGVSAFVHMYQNARNKIGKTGLPPSANAGKKGNGRGTGE